MSLIRLADQLAVTKSTKHVTPWHPSLLKKMLGYDKTSTSSWFSSLVRHTIHNTRNVNMLLNTELNYYLHKYEDAQHCWDVFIYSITVCLSVIIGCSQLRHWRGVWWRRSLCWWWVWREGLVWRSISLPVNRRHYCLTTSGWITWISE